MIKNRPIFGNKRHLVLLKRGELELLAEGKTAKIILEKGYMDENGHVDDLLYVCDNCGMEGTTAADISYLDYDKRLRCKDCCYLTSMPRKPT